MDTPPVNNAFNPPADPVQYVQHVDVFVRARPEVIGIGNDRLALTDGDDVVLDNNATARLNGMTEDGMFHLRITRTDINAQLNLLLFEGSVVERPVTYVRNADGTVDLDNPVEPDDYQEIEIRRGPDEYRLGGDLFAEHPYGYMYEADQQALARAMEYKDENLD